MLNNQNNNQEYINKLENENLLLNSLFFFAPKKYGN